ncbi:T9SS type A sorting domain-containing protein [Kaistella faecalis]|uniref:T9SS type A sorting domain-containing protein n=1 Tax=Kaistella faecalis TaxID=2852098 RepID=UPI001C485F28|nr:T9SS type A sorting domain-containing protein [Chryseobacterium faecale]UFK98540.1 T9SS type A sorting domain-containing protein [Chryseobacterium faecale]
MRRNLFAIALLALSLPFTAQVLVHVDPTGVFYVGENALVYNGGGLQTKGSGILDVRGNVMVQGAATDVLKTLDNAGTGDKTDGGNIILRLNDPANHSAAVNPSTYGQLFISGLTQGSVSAVVDKEYRTAKHGTYQQIALPFYNKQLSSLSGTGIGSLGKTFSNVRYSQNEILTWNNATAVSENLNISLLTPKNTTYYMLGSNGFDSGNPPALMPANSPAPNGSVYTLRGVPYTNGVTEKLINAANGVNFGSTGNAVNSYNERYNSYLQDDWDYPVAPTNPWSVSTFGRNIYQFGNPYLTNLDLGLVGITESGAVTDNNAISSIQGIRYDPGTVVSLSSGTFSSGAKYVNFTAGNPVPVGDVGLVIKPMQTFVIKLRDNNAEVGTNKTLSFDNLRRFKATPRPNGTGYSVNARPGENAATVKQLGVIALSEDGTELARTYYAVYPTAVTGHTSQPTTQSILGGQNIIGTFEENAVNGGYDMNYINSYWLYINEANETDFFGKAIPLALYNNAIKSLKFEIRENTELVENGTHQLSTGVGFYYKAPNGESVEIKQNQVIPVTADKYSLFYGKPSGVLGTDGVAKPSRTMVVYHQLIDNFVVRFDPNWKTADIQVYDMSGKLILAQKKVAADKDYVLDLAKANSAYIVTAVSEKGEKISSKIVR